MQIKDKIEEYQLKLNGRVNIDRPLEIGHNWHVSLAGSITKEERSDNNDGSFTVAYKFEPIQVEVLTPKGETIKAKDKRKLSQKLRGRLFMIWQESKQELDFDEFYDKAMAKLINDCETII